jgi:hypothetical protein
MTEADFGLIAASVTASSGRVAYAVISGGPLVHRQRIARSRAHLLFLPATGATT